MGSGWTIFFIYIYIIQFAWHFSLFFFSFSFFHNYTANPVRTMTGIRYYGPLVSLCPSSALIGHASRTVRFQTPEKCGPKCVRGLLSSTRTTTIRVSSELIAAAVFGLLQWRELYTGNGSAKTHILTRGPTC